MRNQIGWLARLPPEFSDPKYSTVTIQRDLYYGYDTLMENVSDPSHIDFAHHKVTGRRDRAKPLPFKVHESGPWGFAGANNDSPTISSGFYPPCYYYNKYALSSSSLVPREMYIAVHVSRAAKFEVNLNHRNLDRRG